MHQVVLIHRHCSVQHAFLNLGEVHLRRGGAVAECLSERKDVKALIPILDVLHYQLFGDWKLGVERDVRLVGVAVAAAAVGNHGQHLPAVVKARVGSLVHGAVGHGKGRYHHCCADE